MVRSSNSRNVRATVNEIQRVAMAALMMVMAFGGLAMFAGDAAAQKKPSLQILVEDLDVEASRKCGVTKDSLRAPAVLILRQNRIDVASGRIDVPSGAGPWLYIHPTIIISGASCIHSLRVAILTGQEPKDRNGFRANSFESVALCSSGGAGINPASATPKKMTELIELYLKECLAEVSY